MDRLTFDRWWEALPSGLKNPAVKAPCKRGWDAALLQSLSQEAVRDEALEEAASVDQREVELRGWREAIRVLKRDPNAVAEPHEYVDAPTGAIEEHGPAPAAPNYDDGDPAKWPPSGPAAPDVASMVKRLEGLPWPKLSYPDEAEMRDLGYAALPLLQELPALLARLGQAQSRFVVNWTTEGCPKHDGQPWSFTASVYTEIAKRCPLCEPLPGASDD